MQLDMPHIHAVYLDGAALYVVKARHQVDYGRLPRPRRSHKGDRLAGADMQIKMLENIQTFFIAESHVLKIHRPLHLAKLYAFGAVRNGRRRIDRFKYPFKICGYLRKVLHDNGKLRERRGKQRHIAEESDRCTRDPRDAALLQIKGEGIQKHRTDIPKQFHDGRVQLIAAHDAHPILCAVQLQVVIDLLIVCTAVIILNDFLAHD